MNYVVLLFIFLYYKLHFFQLAAMLLSAGDDINAGCVNTAVTEQVCQFRNVLFDGVEGVVPGVEGRLAVFDLHHPLDGPVQEVPVMGDHQDGALVLPEVVLQPDGGVQVQMVGGLIQ